MRNSEGETQLSRREAAIAMRAAVRQSAQLALGDGGGPAAPSRYTIIIPLIGGGALVYHTYTQAFARLDAADLAVWDRVEQGEMDVSDPALAPFLSGGFVVSAARDERAEVARQLDRARFDPSSMILTIAPTMGCNFACAYCFQGLDKPTGRMSPETTDALCDYVADKAEGLRHLHVTWYGGEPLMNRPAIYALSDRMIESCRENNCGYSAFIVTNGYFLDLTTAQELFRRGVRTAQVTLDGSANAHDARRHLLSGKPTYQRICDNLGEVVEHTDMHIAIRVNVDTTNGDDVLGLLDDLKAKGFAGRRNFAVYFAPVEAITDACASCDPDSFAKTDYGQWEADLYRAAFERGLCALPQPPVFHGNCGAVRKNGLVVLPDGALHKCWDTVQTPSLAIGNVRDVTAAEASPRSQAWLQWSPFDNPVCSECPILPSCAGACAFKFVHREQTHGEAGGLPCPSWKFNLAERLFLRAEKMGVVSPDDWDPVLSPTRADAALKTGARHTFASMDAAGAPALLPAE